MKWLFLLMVLALLFAKPQYRHDPPHPPVDDSALRMEVR